MKRFFFPSGKFREVLNKHKAAVTLIISGIVLFIVFLFFKEEKQKDHSFLKMHGPTLSHDIERPKRAAQRLLGVSDAVGIKQVQTVQKRPKRHRERPIKYRADQVIVRPGEYRLPIGSKIKGKLLFPLDTRQGDKTAKVILLEAARFQGEIILAEKTLLFGRMSYTGSGGQVEVHFTRGLTPDGFEFDFSGKSHIDGVYRSRAGGRMAKSMGLTAISDVANVLAQKEALGSGKGTVISHKSTLPNALLYAAGKAARKEAERQMERIEVGGDYVTVKAGTSLVIYLITTFKGGFQ